MGAPLPMVMVTLLIMNVTEPLPRFSSWLMPELSARKARTTYSTEEPGLACVRSIVEASMETAVAGLLPAQG